MKRTWWGHKGTSQNTVPLTPKLDSGSSADDGATAVDGQTLIRTRISNRFWTADDQASSHQGVAQIQAKRDLCAVHQPPEMHGGIFY